MSEIKKIIWRFFNFNRLLDLKSYLENLIFSSFEIKKSFGDFLDEAKPNYPFYF